jgi:hypothetical protein
MRLLRIAPRLLSRFPYKGVLSLVDIPRGGEGGSSACNIKWLTSDELHF